MFVNKRTTSALLMSIMTRLKHRWWIFVRPYDSQRVKAYTPANVIIIPWYESFWKRFPFDSRPERYRSFHGLAFADSFSGTLARLSRRAFELSSRTASRDTWSRLFLRRATFAFSVSAPNAVESNETSFEWFRFEFNDHVIAYTIKTCSRYLD